MRKSILLLLVVLFWQINELSAQKIAVNPGVDIMSRYVWRGLNLGGSSPSIQPSIEVTVSNFTLGTWGAFSTGNNLTAQETDIYLSYTLLDMFSVTVTDYFFPDESLDNNNYFEYDEDKTGHLFEGMVSFNGTEKIPFTLLAAVNFWGADARTFENENQYSTYVEVGYKGVCKDVDYNVFIGGTPNCPDKLKGETGFYGSCEGIINVGVTAVKKVDITDKFTLPVSTSIIINPQAENIFLVLGISL